MEEREWLTSTDLIEMLDLLEQRGQLSERNARLFGVAVYRRISDLLPDQRSRNAVEVAERFADGLASREELQAAHAEANARRMELRAWEPLTEAAEVAEWVCSPIARDSMCVMHGDAQQARATARTEEWDAKLWYAEEGAQADLLRCIFGSPFRPHTHVASSVLTFNDGLVERLARSAYEERSLPEGIFDQSRLAVLADALEDAGCADQTVLGHLRSPGPHTRGCWCVDLLLGRR